MTAPSHPPRSAGPPFRGFILHPTYRMVRGRPVVHLWGVLEGGGGFLVRDGRLTPHFYVEEADAERARELGAENQTATSRVTLHGRRPVVRVEVPRPADTPPLRDRLQRSGIRCWEADVRFALRYLIDRGLKSSIEIRDYEREATEGESRDTALRVFDDPELVPADWTPRLGVLSLDIETDPTASRVLSVALHGCGASEVLLLNPPGYQAPVGCLPFPGEADLLAGLAYRVRELDPDILTGWNVVGFDLTVLARRAGELGVELELGRGPGRLTVQESRYASAPARVSVPGRTVLDGIDLLRSSFVRMDRWGLDAVAREVLGEGKVKPFVRDDEDEDEDLAHPGDAEDDPKEDAEDRDAKDSDTEDSGAEDSGAEDSGNTNGSGDTADLDGPPGRARAILRAFEEDRQRFVDYNLTDARLVTDILEKLQVVELAVERSRLTGLPPDRVAGAIAAFDFLYLSELRPRGVVAPTVGSSERSAPTSGGHVLQPETGLWENVLVLDFQSLYPSLIRTFQIDPLGKIEDPDDPQAADAIRAPNGALFRREPGILTGLLDDLFPRRAAAQERGDAVAAYAIKILMNSFYGVLGTAACRFHDPEVANAITGFGRNLLLWTRRRIEEDYGLRVLYGDTDSLFIEAGEEVAAVARELGHQLAADLDRDLAAHVEAAWGVESRLHLELERLYRKLFLPPVRGGSGHGARKRYAGLVETEEGATRVRLTGMEAVRRDWTELAKSAQRELYERLFHERPVAPWLARRVARLRAGEVEEALLVYRKGLRKSLDAYTSTTPPHVAAARKMSGKPGRVISYLWTTAGPEPAGERRNPIDHEHYVDKQLKPIAEPVLEHLGLDFAKVIGDDRQMELF